MTGLTDFSPTNGSPTDRQNGSDGFGKILGRSFGSTQDDILEAKTFSSQNRKMLVAVELSSKVNDFGLFGFAVFQCFKAILHGTVQESHSTSMVDRVSQSMLYVLKDRFR